jgi:hypothetical protein
MVRKHQTRNLEIPGSHFVRPGMTIKLHSGREQRGTARSEELVTRPCIARAVALCSIAASGGCRDVFPELP